MAYELKSNLARLKSKPFNFVLIKGRQSDMVLVTPKPAPAKLLEDTKKECGDGKPLAKGVCVKEEGKIIFATRAAPAPAWETLLKKILKDEKCSMFLPIELRQLGADESEEATSDEVEDGGEKQSETRATTAATSTAEPVPQARTATSVPSTPTTPAPKAAALSPAEAEALFNKRLKPLENSCLYAGLKSPALKGQLTQLMTEAKALGAKKDFINGNKKFDEVDALLATAAASTPKPTPAEPAKTPVGGPDEAKYRADYKKYIARIAEAARLSGDVGGADVQSTISDMNLSESKGDWLAAQKFLGQADAKAVKVLDRKEFVITRQKHEAQIAAARKIKAVIPGKEKEKTTFGDVVEKEWNDALKEAAKGTKEGFDTAAMHIKGIVAYITKTIDPALAAARKKNGDELQTMREQIEAAGRNGADPNRLRILAVDVFNKTREAEGLGIDPGENARKPFEDTGKWNAGLCKATFQKYDWFGLKACRKAQAIEIPKGTRLKFTDDDMWKLFQYRNKVVNEELDKLRTQYPTLIFKASGSEDIESDIDITVATPGSGEDVTAAKAFNAAIKAAYGKPPGRVFDVNLYPRDYGAIKESFKADYNATALKDSDVDEPEEREMQKLSQVDQDVATLLKQRRFLDEKTFNAMVEDVIKAAPDKESKKRIEKQFEEGEDIYFLTALEKVDKIRAHLTAGAHLTVAATDSKEEQAHKLETQKKLKELDALKGTGGGANLAKMQKLLPGVLDLLEEAFPAEVMETTDAMYLDKMDDLRKDQARIRLLKVETDAVDLDEHGGKPCEAVHGKEPHKAWRKKELGALEVKVKKDMFTNIVFANEAYMSQGAIKHIVEGKQAKDPATAAKVLAGLKPSDLLQSANEQMADFFKDMKHYEGAVGEMDGRQKREATGEAFVHASKYLSRLLEAAQFLGDKYPEASHPELHKPPFTILKVSGVTSPKDLQKKVDDVMLNLRKSAAIPPEVKGEVGALEVQELFKVTDIAGFRDVIANFGVELNQRVRQLAEFKKDQLLDLDAERQFFRTAAPV